MLTSIPNLLQNTLETEEYAKCNSTRKNYADVGTGTANGGELLASSLTYRPMSMNCFPLC